MDQRTAQCIGYFPKKTATPDGWFADPALREICSVSACISPGPDGWMAHWRHNAWGVYDTEAAAVSVIQENQAAFDLYAYRVFPVRFDGRTQIPIVLPRGATEDLRDYTFLGYDVVARAEGTPFGCSPLSCNNGCGVFRVNPYCLLAELAEAWAVCARIAVESSETGGWEPGPYYLVEVHRKRSYP